MCIINYVVTVYILLFVFAFWAEEGGYSPTEQVKYILIL